MTTNYEYDPEAGSKADDVASRIDLSAAYVGKFKAAYAIKSENTGTEGIAFDFNSPGGGTANFSVYTRKEDGTPTFGWNQIQAMMSILGLRGLRSVTGNYEGYDFDAGKRVQMTGEIFPDLLDKDIGLVLQKELYTGNDGKERFRMNLFGIFHPVSKLTASELKDRKTAPEKLEKMLRGLKNKDSRKAVAASSEPAQPSVGVEGSF